MIDRFGGFENGGTGEWYLITSAAEELDATSRLGGTYCRKIMPDMAGIGAVYGRRVNLSGTPVRMLVPFMFELDSVPDDNSIVISELSDGGTTTARRLSINANGRLFLSDKDDDVIGETGDALFTVGEAYRILWLFDKTDTDNTRDTVWIYDIEGGSPAWTKVIDEIGHGDGAVTVNRLTMGTPTGKTIPTANGDFFIDDMALQDLLTAPHTTPFGSIATEYKVASGVGNYNDFDTGGPDWNDVKQIPSDDAATTDKGDAIGEQQSYAVGNAGGGDLPLAVNIMGTAFNSGAARNDIQLKYFIRYDGTDYFTLEQEVFTSWHDFQNNTGPNSGVSIGHFTTLNGLTWSEAIFNACEVGAELTDVDIGAGATYDLTQIGLEYCKEGPVALPDDFPTFFVPKVMFY